MNDNELKQLVADTGRRLLDKGLVARTWGNISARKDATKFAISPSGLGYENMDGSDVPIYDMEAKTWEGSRKPSSEKKIHAAAYKLYPEVNFVIHTHQDFATAIGLASTADLDLTDEEKELLGEISIAGYGLPGTDKLADNVTSALRSSQVVLMAHHGALILGKDVEDTLKKAEALEEVCKRAVIKKIGTGAVEGARMSAGLKKNETDSVEKANKGADSKNSENDVLDKKSIKIAPFKAQLDDMAQMIGPKYSERAVAKAKEGLSEDDLQALSLLLNKAIICKKYTEALGIDGRLSSFDCILMRTVYKFKYSKQKNK